MREVMQGVLVVWSVVMVLAPSLSQHTRNQSWDWYLRYRYRCRYLRYRYRCRYIYRYKCRYRYM